MTREEKIDFISEVRKSNKSDLETLPTYALDFLLERCLQESEQAV